MGNGLIKFLVSFILFNIYFDYNLGSVFLPSDDAKAVFLHCINNLPAVDAHLNEFASYLRNFWMPKLDKIVCWDDTQPRTNNAAEAYHSKLEKSFER